MKGTGHKEKCVVSGSVGKVGDLEKNAGIGDQRVAAERLRPILSCLEK